jgi:hypothetical protein
MPKSPLNIFVATLTLTLFACQSRRSIPMPTNIEQDKVEVINAFSFDSQMNFKDTRVGGLSSCFYSAKEKALYALSDDRSENSAARFYKLTLNKDQNRFDFSDVTILKDQQKRPFALGTIDSEALVISGEALYVTDEGEQDGEKILRQPRVLKFNLAGEYLSQIGLPAKFQFSSEDKIGPRDNKTLESLALFGNTLTLIFEGPFKEHKKTSFQKSLPLNLVQFDAEKFSMESSYYLSPVSELTAGEDLGKADHGVAELIAVGPDNYFVLERSYLKDIGQNFVRVFEYKNNEKKLWLDFDHIRSKFPASEQKLDNIEAMCEGPQTHDGKKTLVFISDNNFSDKQRTLFVFLKVK